MEFLVKIKMFCINNLYITANMWVIIDRRAAAIDAGLASVDGF